MTHPHPVPAAAAVLTNEKDEILLQLRADCRKWAVPGGKLDADETIERAARRELYEEAGIRACNLPAKHLGFAEECGSGEHNKHQRFITHFVLWTKWFGFPRRMEPQKCLGFRWFPASEMPHLDEVTDGTRVFITRMLPELMVERELSRIEAYEADNTIDYSNLDVSFRAYQRASGRSLKRWAAQFKPGA